MRYRADITAGSLKIPESRVVADLLIQGIDDAQWKQAILIDNLLQTRTPATAKRLAHLIRGRLELMTAPLWELVRDGNLLTSTHACLAAAVKHSSLLADYIEQVVKEHHKMFKPALKKEDWEDFVYQCYNRDPEMPKWNESTTRRLRSSVFQILEQAGYIEDTKTLKLQQVHIASDVLRCLYNADEHQLIDCLEVTS